MKFAGLIFYAVCALTTIAGAQSVLLPERKIILLKGSIYASWFEMSLVRDGENLSGSYFYVKSGRAKLLKVRGTIAADGKVILREFDAANAETGKFQGKIGENSDNYNLYFNGVWTNSRRKYLQFGASGQIINFTGKRRIETLWIIKENKAKRFYLAANYPEIVGENPSDFYEVNRAFRELTVATADKFRKQSRAQTAAKIKNRRGVSGDLSADYDVKYADDDFISLQFIYFELIPAAQVELSEEVSLTYDLKNSARLRLGDLFAPDAKYLETIAAFCLKELQSRPPFNNQKLAEGAWAKGASPLAANCEIWNLTRKGLLVTFRIEQIAPKSTGFSRVLIPFSELKKIAKSGGAIEKIMRRENL